MYNKISSIHLELTDKCNASCPMCARNILGGEVNPKMPLVEITLDDIKQMLPPEFLANIDFLYSCGNYGDPIAAKDTLEIYKWLREVKPDIRLGMNTNGSAKKTEWWYELGQTIEDKGYVIFGLDGLEDTNHIYRRGTNWQKIMDNVEAFIDAGGNARWDFIVFKHNEHQIDEARKLSEEMGFSKFQVKKTGRFFSNTKLQGKDNQQVLNRNGEVEYYIEKPTQEKWVNNSLQKEQDIIKKFGSMQNYLDKTEVKCKVIEEDKIYISAEGLVFPCCWIANQMYLWWQQVDPPVVQMLNANGGKEAIDARNIPIEDIVNGPFFTAIKNSWTKSSCANGKLAVCAKTCGTDFDQFKSQYS